MTRTETPQRNSSRPSSELWSGVLSELGRRDALPRGTARARPTLGEPADTYDESVGRQAAVALYVLTLVAVVVGVDVLFFRHHFLERLIANVGIVLVFAAFGLSGSYGPAEALIPLPVRFGASFWQDCVAKSAVRSACDTAVCGAQVS